MSTIYGCAHVAGEYWVTTPGTGSFVLDGFELIKGLGFGAVKYFLSAQYASQDFSLETWTATPTTLTELAQTTQMVTSFSDATIKHYVLNVFGFTTTDHADLWKFPFYTQTDILSKQYTEFYDFTEHLLQTYDGYGKTFVLQNWEGDWALRASTATTGFNNITGRRIDRMIAFYQTRARAIRDAKKDNPTSDVIILHAMEANRVEDSIKQKNRPSILNSILPRLRGYLDLVSYSAYDGVYDLRINGMGAWWSSESEMITELTRRVALGIDALSAAADCPCFIGEWGVEENNKPAQYSTANIVQAMYDVGETKDVPYHIYWEIWNNEVNNLYALYDSGGDLTGAGTKWQQLLA